MTTAFVVGEGMKMNGKELEVNASLMVNPEFTYYAHKDKNSGRMEKLLEHADLCMAYFEKIVEEKQLVPVWEHFVNTLFKDGVRKEIKDLFFEMLVNVIYLHDIGKVNPLFQKEKMGQKIKVPIEGFGKFSSRHSIVSSICYFTYFSEEIKKTEDKETAKYLRHLLFLNAFVISRHHSNLTDFSEFVKQFKGSEKEDEGEALWEAAVELNEAENSVFTMKFEPNRMNKFAKSEEKFLEIINKDESAFFFTYVRLLYSILVSCDYYATTEFCNQIAVNSFGSIQNIEQIKQEFELTEVNQKIRQYQKVREKERREHYGMNDLRSELFLDAETELTYHSENNIFYLEAPTGSGKSNTAFNLSFELIAENPALQKIYYVYPFNTLVEQNYQSLQKTFGKEGEVIHEVGVINSLTPIQVKDKEYEKGLLDREFLNFPIVMTTSVSFFQVLFGSEQKNLFAFHQFCNSVVVLDEIQNYKSLIWSEIITFLTSFSKLLNMKFIIMSATLPDLSSISLIEGGTVRLVKDRSKFFENPIFRDRVHIKYDLLHGKIGLEELYEHVCSKEKSRKMILMEFISKATAYEFYEMLTQGQVCGEIESKIALMTGDNNGLEREEMLDEITHFSCEGQGYILVATQVVEAGVDIDMDIGYKDISKVDSEEQFMGRINRSCKKNGEVYFFSHDRMKRIYQGDLRGNDEFSLKDESMREILVTKKFYDFYKKVLHLVTERGKEKNQNNLEHFFQDTVGSLQFPVIAERMKLIDEDDWSMSVYLARVVRNKKGEEFDGKEIWKRYKELLADSSLSYARKQIELSEVRCKMNYFMYRVKKNDIPYNDVQNDIYYIEDGEKYFDNGRLLKEKLEGDKIDFIDI